MGGSFAKGGLKINRTSPHCYPRPLPRVKKRGAKNWDHCQGSGPLTDNVTARPRPFSREPPASALAALAGGSRLNDHGNLPHFGPIPVVRASCFSKVFCCSVSFLNS